MGSISLNVATTGGLYILVLQRPNLGELLHQQSVRAFEGLAGFQLEGTIFWGGFRERCVGSMHHPWVKFEKWLFMYIKRQLTSSHLSTNKFTSPDVVTDLI